MSHTVGSATVILGDWNLSAAEVGSLAREIGGQLAKGRGPDHAIVRGAAVRSVRRLGKHGSDAHEAILYTLDVDGTTVRILGWNVWVGQKPAAVKKSLERLIDAHDPDVVMLNEAYRCTYVLRELGGFRVYQGRDVGEGADVAVLVRRRHEVVNDGRLQMQQRWEVVSHDKVRAGREYQFVRLVLNGDGPTLRLLDIHFPTDNPVNAAAASESRDRVIRWAGPGKKEKP